MARLFNAYVAVRWSAASKPTAGADAIGVGVLKRDVRFRLAYEAHSPATRAEGEKLLAAILDERVKRRERTLVCCEFPLGLPRGVAAGLKLAGDAPWRAVWDQLARMVKDKADNTNNRFGVASEINRRLTGGPFPFWGCPPRDTLTTLQPKRTREHGPGDVPEFRQTEIAAGAANPVWKLYYSGAVGGPMILGIPMVRRLKAAHEAAMAVWPFETGLKALGEADLDGVAIVTAEASPSRFKGQPLPGESKDATQSRAMVEALARLDEAGRLGALFAPVAKPTAQGLAGAEAEEGWILGV